LRAATRSKPSRRCASFSPQTSSNIHAIYQQH
jgi:hypothetical protein